jgi:integrase
MNNTLTDIPSILYLLSQEGKEEREMGTIRARGKCPVCQKSFEHISKLGLICPEHKTVPRRFYIDLSWKGKRVRIFSHKSGRSLDSYQIALETLQHINYEIRNHIFEPSKYIASDIKKYLFENLIKQWLELKERSDLSPSYIPKLKQFEKDYFQFFKGQDIRDLRTSHIHDFFYQLPENLSSKTKKNIISALHGFFSWLTKMEYIEKMPVFPTIKIEQPDWKWLDVDIQGDILLAIPESDRYIYLFLALHGCRPSEARALKVKDIDFSHNAVNIKRTFTGKSGNMIAEHTKTKRQRTIPINTEMLEVFKYLCKDKLPEAFVFINPRTGKPYAKSTYQEVWQSACEAVGLKISSYEGLRHSFASQRVSRGIDIYLISKVLGHSDIRTTQRYSHTNLDALKSIMSIETVTRLSPRALEH